MFYRADRFLFDDFMLREIRFTNHWSRYLQYGSSARRNLKLASLIQNVNVNMHSLNARTPWRTATLWCNAIQHRRCPIFDVVVFLWTAQFATLCSCYGLYIIGLAGALPFGVIVPGNYSPVFATFGSSPRFKGNVPSRTAARSIPNFFELYQNQQVSQTAMAWKFGEKARQYRGTLKHDLSRLQLEPRKVTCTKSYFDYLLIFSETATLDMHILTLSQQRKYPNSHTG